MPDDWTDNVADSGAWLGPLATTARGQGFRIQARRVICWVMIFHRERRAERLRLKACQ